MRRHVIAGVWMLVLPALIATGAPPTVAQQVREQNEALSGNCNRRAASRTVNSPRFDGSSNDPATSARGIPRSRATP